MGSGEGQKASVFLFLRNVTPTVTFSTGVTPNVTLRKIIKEQGREEIKKGE